MSFMCHSVLKRARVEGVPGGVTGDGYGLRPYIGIADWYLPRTSETILNLSNLSRGNYETSPNTGTAPFNTSGQFFVPPFSANTGSGNDGLWIAYPKIYGQVDWQELDSNFNDYPFSADLNGANGDPIDSSKWGPKEVIMNIDGVSIPFWLYMNDWPGVGTLYYRTK